jgi:hypothetical protein
MIPVRSLMPLTAIAIVAGALLWGPWVSLALAIATHIYVGKTQ